MAVKERISKPCDECLLTCRMLKPKGKKAARYLIVTSAPNHQQIRYGEHFHPDASRLIGRNMKRLDFTRSEFVYHAGVKCEYNEKHWVSKDRTKIMRQCREYLLRIVEKLKPDVIIPMGAQASRQVLGRAVKITKARGVVEWSEELNTWVLPMLDPTFVCMYPQHEPIFETDCNTLRQFIDADLSLEALKTTDAEYELVDDLQFLIDEDPKILGFDVETRGLRPSNMKNKLLTLQFSPEPGRAYMVLWDHPKHRKSDRYKKKIKRQVRELLCKPDRIIVGQNLKFDVLWVLWRMKIRATIHHDTLLLAALLDENQQDKSLDTLIKIHVPDMAGYNDAFNAQYDKARMDLVPLDDLIPYGCGDSDAALRLYLELWPRVEDDSDLCNHYQVITIPGLNAFASIERRGQLIDEEALEAFEEVLSDDVTEQRHNIYDQIPRAVKRTHLRGGTNPKGISLSRRDFLADVLFTHPSGFQLEPVVFTKTTKDLPDEDMRVPSVSSKDHLPYFFESCPFTMDLAQYIKDERLLSTNVRKFRENYMYRGMIYPSYSLHTAVTGRSASQDPNAQNFPVRGENAPAYRRIFIPPPGKIMLMADLSQAELRIAACMADEPTMIEIYQEGGDIHTETALIVLDMNLEEFNELSKDERELARFRAKAVNFGFMYGMGWRKFRIYAKTQFGVEFTEKEAERVRYGFFDKYYMLDEWHMEQRNFAHENGYVRSYSGRIRHLPMIHSEEEFVVSEAERQAINSPVQEFASSLGVMSMGRMDRELDPQYLALTAFVHDAIYAYCDPRYVEWGAKTLKYYMESNDIEALFGHDLPVPIVAEVAFGVNGTDKWDMKNLQEDKKYDFSKLKMDIELPKQKTPPNDGLLEEPVWGIAA